MLTGPASLRIDVEAPMKFRVIIRCGKERSLCRKRVRMEGSGGLCQPCPEKLSTQGRNSIASVGFWWRLPIPYMGLEGAICPLTCTWFVNPKRVPPPDLSLLTQPTWLWRGIKKPMSATSPNQHVSSFRIRERHIRRTRKIHSSRKRIRLRT